ncbi:MAG: Gfo/Idh/MocA family oxidoreductase [Tetragenococcus koreensis]|nr:Gfo/Idh/MocA family oxidoreductase [Tetragenococcus koreensis]
MKQINYGIISTANIVPRFVKGINESKFGVAYAIGGSNISKAKSYAKQLGIPKYYGSYQEVYEDPNVDIVYIATYNGGHFQCILDALNHNKHVLCEKPMCLTAEQVQECFGLAKEKQLFLMEAQKSVFLPAIKEVKKILEDKIIGDIQWINIISSHIAKNRGAWFNSFKKGGGIFRGAGTYPLEFLLTVFEQSLTNVSGILSIKDSETDNSAILDLTLQDRTLISILVTKDIHDESRVEIFGTKGKITIPNYWKTDRYIIETNEESENRQLPMNSEFVYEVDHVNDQLLSGKLLSPVMTPEVTYSAIKIIDDIYQKELGKKTR